MTFPRNYIVVLSILMVSVIVSCDKFEYSPYQTELPKGTPKGLNAHNIALIKSNEESGLTDDTVTIIYTGDSQRFYDDLEKLVRRANQIPNVDFLVFCGDIADFGLLQEYLWIHERLKRLHYPYLAVIGNHDLVHQDGEVFTEMYGDKNFTLDYKGYTFLFHDTNSREYNFNGQVPNIGWLASNINQSKSNWLVGVSHVPPFDVDFDSNLEHPYKNLLASTPNFILSLHGRLHNLGDTTYYGDHVRYMTTTSVNKKSFLLLKLIDGKIFKELITYD